MDGMDGGMGICKRRIDGMDRVMGLTDGMATEIENNVTTNNNIPQTRKKELPISKHGEHHSNVPLTDT